MKNISWKTGLIGIFSMTVLICSLALVYFDKATYKEVGESLGYITLFITGIVALFAKDKDKTGLPK